MRRQNILKLIYRGIRTDIREVAKEIVAENLELTTEQAKIFWPLYDEYMAELKILGDQEVKLTGRVYAQLLSDGRKNCKQSIR
ncbi:MAG: hypothetical protein MZV64_06995 [Ignavibacteriales bacterium]|nr:hypothetical protein [Ignavibacteriales bacterium]